MNPPCALPETTETPRRRRGDRETDRGGGVVRDWSAPLVRAGLPLLSDHQGALAAEIGRKRRRAAGLFWREEKCGGGEKGGEQVAVR